MEVDVTGNGQPPEPAGEAQPAPAGGGDDVLEYGRYRVFETADGGWVVARAAGTCQRCQDCGCGDQQDPIAVPGFVIGMARAQADGGGLLAKVKAAMGRGDG